LGTGYHREVRSAVRPVRFMEEASFYRKVKGENGKKNS